jgi:hypothetical protein
MDSSERRLVNAVPADGMTVLARRSWTAYVGPLFWIAVGAFFMTSPWNTGVPAVIGGGICVALQLYRVLYRHSTVLYQDRAGVWVSEGLLPWQKGIHGVKWRDLDEAAYFRGFWSWVFRSYEIRISHRFTKDSEIRLAHMHRGHRAVESINSTHLERTSPAELDAR